MLPKYATNGTNGHVVNDEELIGEQITENTDPLSVDPFVLRERQNMAGDKRCALFYRVFQSTEHCFCKKLEGFVNQIKSCSLMI
jgi:hypothetical protein